MGVIGSFLSWLVIAIISISLYFSCWGLLYQTIRSGFFSQLIPSQSTRTYKIIMPIGFSFNPGRYMIAVLSFTPIYKRVDEISFFSNSACVILKRCIGTELWIYVFTNKKTRIFFSNYSIISVYLHHMKLMTVPERP